MTGYLLHPNASLADDMLEPLHTDGVQGQVERQLRLGQDDGQGTRVFVPLQLAVEDQRHNDDSLFCQDKELDIHSAALSATQNLPVQRVIGQECDLPVAEEHRLVALWDPDVAHPRPQDVVPVGKGGSKQRAFSFYRHLGLRHSRRLRWTTRRHLGTGGLETSQVEERIILDLNKEHRKQLLCLCSSYFLIK